MYERIEDAVRDAAGMGASDLHISCGLPLRIRSDGKLRPFPGHAEPAADDDCERFAAQLVPEEELNAGTAGEFDLSDTIGNVRVRGCVYLARGHFSIALRILNETIPELNGLGLPAKFMEIPRLRRGLVLVTGTTGSGKSTTLAAVINEINRTRADHVITLEDPIEYLHVPDKCSIDQREVGNDTESFATGLRSALRQDPDVILIGEMRDLESIETALTAAETGHLVLATVHTRSASEAVDRLIDVFPGDRQKQIRTQLSMTLQAVLSQQLLPKKGGGRIAACELMMVTPGIRNNISKGESAQIAQAVDNGQEYGSISMDRSILKLLQEGKIDAETARTHCHNAEYIRRSTMMGNRIEKGIKSYG